MQTCRNRLQQIQAEESKVNNSRIRLDSARFKFALAPFRPPVKRYMSCGGFERTTDDTRNEITTMQDSVRFRLPRSLSTDRLLRWLHETPTFPLATRTTSKEEQPAPSTLSTEPRKSSSLCQRWRDFISQRRRTPPLPHTVSAIRQASPSKRPHSPMTRKQPTPHQGGFIEHLGENARYQDMVGGNGQGGKVHPKQSAEARETEDTSVQKRVCCIRIKKR